MPCTLPEGLSRALRRALGDPFPVLTEPAESPAAPGSYLLLARLAVPLPLRGRFAGVTLPSGWFVYAGSARGPGGLAARLGRHSKEEKRLRWHIDQLTMGTGMLCALPFPDSPEAPAPTECALIARLLKGGAFSPPVPGFGSSDCHACPAHLLMYPERG